jgi:hypothetical protein
MANIDESSERRAVLVSGSRGLDSTSAELSRLKGKEEM